MNRSEDVTASDFIRDVVAGDLASGKRSEIVTRFPPEPNGYLHIGHAKAICIDFGVAEDFKGRCHLRFDDTNPTKEDEEFVEGIKRDVKWLGWDWGEHLYFASDYFSKMHECALRLISEGKAYVDDLSSDDVRDLRGTLTEPGTNSPHRDRGADENLGLFERMTKGEFPDGSRVLRAKIDMAHPNLNMRDPVMYRILHAAHHRTGDAWCVYPTYDWAHGLEDSIEGVTHSLCDLDFENHRPLYDWFLEALAMFHPQQIEFARLNITHMVLSKRKLRELVEGGHVDGWDDPRMPTLGGLRRRGYTPGSIRTFCRRIGVTKVNSFTDIAVLENCIREELNRSAPRVMAVLRPLRLVIENYPDDREEELEAVNNPEDPSAGSRSVPFSKELYIERDDFREEAPKRFFRLTPGREVRLRYGYFVTCTGVVKDDETGEVVEVRCTYDPETRGGDSPDGRKVKGTIHWVSARHAVEVPVRLYDRLFSSENPDGSQAGKVFTDDLNPTSLTELTARVEPCLRDAAASERYQFERTGYFCVDPVDSVAGRPVFNRIVSLRDTWAKIEKKSS
ncbi:MAG: glutamine--tRNA ligase/YqeY domain fusion protein [Lentisphaerae bacterium]|nr:glutamine--tRNA ligase/YqeY domain fusion protein [Lentisphaerota bacterium]